MELYIIRHAEAASLADAGVRDDAARPLTQKGLEQARQVAQGLVKHGIELQAIVTSPLLRARQTAEEMAAHWSGTAPDVRICESLAPGGKRRKLSNYVKEMGLEKLALVGHQPDLGELIGWLIGGKKAQIDLAKAGVAYLHSNALLGKGSASLSWIVTPEFM